VWQEDFDYAVGQELLLREDGILHKAEEKYVRHYIIMQVHINSTIRIQQGTKSGRIRFRRTICLSLSKQLSIISCSNISVYTKVNVL